MLDVTFPGMTAREPKTVTRYERVSWAGLDTPDSIAAFNVGSTVNTFPTLQPGGGRGGRDAMTLAGSSPRQVWQGTPIARADAVGTMYEVWMRDNGSVNIIGGIALASGSGINGYQAVLDLRNGTGSTAALQIRLNFGTGSIIGTATTFTVTASTWYRLTLEILPANELRARAYDEAGTLLGTASGTQATHQTLYPAAAAAAAAADAAVFNDFATYATVTTPTAPALGTPQVGDNWSYGSGRLAKAVGQGQGLPSLSLTMTCPGASAFTLIDSDIQAKFYMDDQVTEWHERFGGTTASASESALGTFELSVSPNMRKLDVTRTADITKSIGTKLGRFSLPEARDGDYRCPADPYIIDVAYRRGERSQDEVSAGDLLYVLAAPAIQDVGALQAEAYPEIIGSAVPTSPVLRRTNLCNNPGVEVNLTGWTSVGTSSSVIRQVTGLAHSGVARLQVQPGGSGPGRGARFVVTPSAAPGKTYQVGAWVFASQDNTYEIVTRTIGPGSGVEESTPFVFAGTATWIFVKSNPKVAQSDATDVHLEVRTVSAALSDTFYMDDVIIQDVSFVPLTSSFSGATPASGSLSYAWTGTAENSTSEEYGYEGATPFVYVLRPNGDVVRAFALPNSGSSATHIGVDNNGPSIDMDYVTIGWKDPGDVFGRYAVYRAVGGQQVSSTGLGTTAGLILGLDGRAGRNYAFRSGGAATPANQTRADPLTGPTTTVDGLFRGAAFPYWPASPSGVQAWVYGSLSGGDNKWWLRVLSSDPAPTDVGAPSGGNMLEADSGIQLHVTDRVISAYFDVFGNGMPVSPSIAPPIVQFSTDEPIAPFASAVSNGGFLATVLANRREIQLYMTIPTTFAAYVYWYTGLASGDVHVEITPDAISRDDLISVPAYPSWRDNVWKMVCELALVTGNQVKATDRGIAIVKRQNSQIDMPDNVDVDPIELTSYVPGGVSVVSQNSRFTLLDPGVNQPWSTHFQYQTVYDSGADGDRDFTVETFGSSQFVVDTPNHILYAYPDDRNGSGLTYTAVNAETLEPINTSQIWLDFNIQAADQSILITISARAGINQPQPITISIRNLIIRGIALVAEPSVLRITGTEGDDSRVLNSPFLTTPAAAMTQGVQYAYVAESESQGVTARFNAAAVNAQVATGKIVRIGNANYIVDQYGIRGDIVALDMTRHSMQGRGNNPEAIWYGKTAAEFDAFWSRRRAIEYSMSPLDH